MGIRYVNCCNHVTCSEELNDRYERAAAIAVFQGNIRRGIAALKNGASVALKAKATAKSMCMGHLAVT